MITINQVPDKTRRISLRRRLAGEYSNAKKFEPGGKNAQVDKRPTRIIAYAFTVRKKVAGWLGFGFTGECVLNGESPVGKRLSIVGAESVAGGEPEDSIHILLDGPHVIADQAITCSVIHQHLPVISVYPSAIAGKPVVSLLILEYAIDILTEFRYRIA